MKKISLKTITFALVPLFLASATTLQGQNTGITLSAGPADAAPAGPDVGDPAPGFSLAWADTAKTGAADQPFTLKEAAGKPVVLAFYPKDFTSGCTAEMKTFTEQYDELFGPDVTVVGISADSVETHQRFAKSLGLPFKLLSDPDQKVARLYGSAGKRYAKRTVYVIDGNGKVVYRDLKFGAIDPTAYEALKAAVQKAKNAD